MNTKLLWYGQSRNLLLVKLLFIYISSSLTLFYSCSKDENSPPEFISMENANPVDYVGFNNAWLAWNFQDPDGDFMTYDLYVGTINPPDTIADASLGDKRHNVSGLKPLTTYYWKVVARDTWGATSESDVMSFTTRNKLDYLDLFTGKYSGTLIHTSGYSPDCCRDTIDTTYVAKIGRIREDAILIELDSICQFEARYLQGNNYPMNYFECLNSSSPPDYFFFFGDSIYCRYKKNGVSEAFHFYGKKR